SGLCPALIGIRPARRCRDDALVELDAVLIAHAIERRQHVAGEFARFLQHGGGDVAVEIAVMPSLDGGLQPRGVVEGEQDVGDRRGIGHGGARTGQGGWRYATVSHETARVSMAGRAILDDYGANYRGFPPGTGRAAPAPCTAALDPHGE